MTAATVAYPAAHGPNFGAKISNVGLTCQTLEHAWLTAETDEEDDAVQFGYLPGGVTVVGFLNYCAELDSDGTPTITHTITLGSTDLVVEDDLPQTGGGEFHAIVPQVLTAPTLVTVTTVAPATTHANGTQYLTFLYYSS
jgi:hypothetical protein